MKKLFKKVCLSFCLMASFNVSAAFEETDVFNQFVAKMVDKHQFDEQQLKQLFQSVEIKQGILDAMERPAEGLAWYQYRKIFMTDSRINGGVKFWQTHQQALDAVEKKYGVPAPIIVAIIGVETRYGGNTGHHRVIDALSTLAFQYPKRSRFFVSELEHFLLLCRDEKMNPLEPTGSYAGAMGIPQFMPSSFRTYAADFEEDNQRDIWSNPADAIASVANYFVKHQWQTGEAVAIPVVAQGTAFQQALTKGLKPDMSWQSVQGLAVTAKQQVMLADSTEVKLLSFQQEDGEELWLGLNNFYVITRYNHSPLYAMAVFQLSEAIKQAFFDQVDDSEKQNEEKSNEK